jgi:NADPH:quinone reductase-like Zn-dependent oxidoreductase
VKAIVYEKYGPPEVLQLKEVKKPIPKDNEVLIKVLAVAVTIEDTMIRGSKLGLSSSLPMRMMFGLTRPKNPIPGFELAGEIEAVGKDVKRFKRGDQVFGINLKDAGAYAEYKCLPEDRVLAMKPSNMTHEEAIAAIGAIVALHPLRDKADIQSGQEVLINGASGSVGTAAIQVAKYYGAEVTGVCSTTNLELVKSLGADKVIDYTKVDFAKTGQTYDIVFNTVGKTSFSRCKDSLKQEGVYLTTVPSLTDSFQRLWISRVGSRKIFTATNAFRPASDINKDLSFIKDLMEADRIKPVIDRTYPLEEIVEAHRYVERGHKKGNVVITVEHDS